MRRTVPCVAILALAALAASCGDAQTPVDSGDSSVPSPAGPAAGGPALGAPGGASVGPAATGRRSGEEAAAGEGAADGAPAPGARAADPPPTSPDPKAVDRIALRATLPENDLALFDPVLVDISFVNVSQAPVDLWDFEGDVARRIAVRFRSGDAPWQFSSTADPETAPSMTTLAPGKSIDFQIDLVPILRETPVYGIGTMEFSLALGGDGSKAPPGVKAWNLDGSTSAVSRELKIRIAPPEWFTATGADSDTYHQVRSEIERWMPGSPAEGEIVSRVSALGPAGIAAAALLAQRLEWPGVQDDAGPSKALRFLRKMGPSVTDAVRSAPPSPVMSLIRSFAADDAREIAKEAPPQLAAEMRAIGSGDRAPSLEITLMGPEVPGGAQVVVAGDGALWVKTGIVTPSPAVFRRELPPEDLAALKRAVNRAKPWLWRPLRGIGRPDERDVRFELRRGSEPVWTCTLPSVEAAAGNPWAADVLSAVRELVRSMPGASSIAAVRPEPQPPAAAQPKETDR